MVVYTENGRSVGLVVERILDIATEGLDGDFQLTDIDGPLVVGTTVVQERVMEMLDVRQAILAADPHFYESDEPSGATLMSKHKISTFRVDGELFGVDAMLVQEVGRYAQLTAVPLAPPAVAGDPNLRGEVVTALDLRRMLGRPDRR